MRFLLFITFICASQIFADESQIALIEKLSQSVISVFPASDDSPPSGGSAVLISADGYALTNFHVTLPSGNALKCALPDGILYDAVVVGLDPVGDIALIKLLGRTDFPFVKFGNSDSVQVGDTAFVMGNPFMLAVDYKPSVSKGIISGVRRYQFPSGTFLEYTDCLQTDAAVNPGNSGGPLFDEKGDLIGIIGRCSFEKRGRVNVGIGFAVSSNQTQHFLGVLKSGKIVDHASCGFTVRNDKNNRVIVDNMLEASDAFRCGIREGDEIIRFGGRLVDSANMLKNVLGIFPRDWVVPISVRGEDGKRFDYNIRLSGVHSEAQLIELTEKMPNPPIPDAVKPFFEKKRGYANFHFNRQELNRVLTNWRKENFKWNLSGEIDGSGEKFRFDIDENGVSYDLPTDKGIWLIDAKQQEGHLNAAPDYHFIAPQGSGGLFAALSLWRLLATDEKLDFGDVVYAGKAPIRGDLSNMLDVVDVVWDSSFAKFYFCPESGQLALLEFFSDSQTFPCQMYFDEKGIEIQNGNSLFGRLKTNELNQKKVRFDPPASSLQPPASSLPFAKTAKIYGRGGFRGMTSYQSGCIISENGYILTASSGVLNAEPIIAVLDSGLRYVAELHAVDPIAELAILKIDANGLPCFSLETDFLGTQASSLQAGRMPALPGKRVYALSNAFNISNGNEAVSVQSGVISVKTQLEAKRGAFEMLYKGPIYVVDFTTNNPGAKGGALIDAESGEFLGMLGKELKNANNEVWLNYVIPAEQIQERVNNMLADRSQSLISAEALRADQEFIPEDASKILRNWGISLVPNVSYRTPPFIDSVRSGSRAELFGLKSDDLIVLVNGQLTPSITAFEKEIFAAEKEQPILITVERNNELIEMSGFFLKPDA